MSTPASPQTCPLQPLLHPSPCHLFSLLICKALVPAKTPQKQEQERTTSSLLCRALHCKTVQPETLQKLQRGRKIRTAWASVPSCPLASSCVHWDSGEAASLSLEHGRECWLFLCIPNETAGTRGCCGEAAVAGPGSGGRRL